MSISSSYLDMVESIYDQYSYLECKQILHKLDAFPLSKRVDTLKGFILFQLLPDEILDHVFSYLSPNELLTARAVCTRWQALLPLYSPLCHARNGAYALLTKIDVGYVETKFLKGHLLINDVPFSLKTGRRSFASNIESIEPQDVSEIATLFKNQIPEIENSEFCAYTDHCFVYAPPHKTCFYVVNTDFTGFSPLKMRLQQCVKIGSRISLISMIASTSLLMLSLTSYVMYSTHEVERGIAPSYFPPYSIFYAPLVEGFLLYHLDPSERLQLAKLMIMKCSFPLLFLFSLQPCLFLANELKALKSLFRQLTRTLPPPSLYTRQLP